MNDRVVLGCALAAFCGALVPASVGWTAVAAGLVSLVVLAPAIRLPSWVLAPVIVLVLCSTMSARSWAGLEPQPAGSVAGIGTIVVDPERNGAATTAVIRVEGRRYLATGYRGVGAILAVASAGDRVEVSGSRRPYAGSDERRAALHVGDRLALEEISVSPASNPLWRAANVVRGLIGGGAASLPDDRRALFTGIVYGDDREQSTEHEVDFRLVGLTHLLAVSGQNVAYALTVMGPVIRSGGRSTRWIMTLTILAVFATVTRFEPSVLRATVMAGIAVTGRTLGRETASGRALGLTVVALLLIDPLLAQTIAFRLSVAASGGIIWLAPGIRRRLRGPGWLREASAVTIAAQLAVAPVIVTTFGPISPLSVPANVIAGPLAGLIMGWGMSAGLFAGLVGGPAAAAVHRITDVALVMLETVAAQAAAAPVGRVGLWWVVGVVCVVAARPWWRLNAGAAIGIALGAAALVWTLVPIPRQGAFDVGWDSQVSVSSDEVVLRLGDERQPSRLLEDLAILGIGAIDVVTTAEPSFALDLVAARHRVRAVLDTAEDVAAEGS